MKKIFLQLAAFLAIASGSIAAIPPAEKLLPDDTVMLFSIPDFTKALDIYNKSPQVQFWNDPAMKPFRDKFMNKLKAELITPLEHDLGVHFDDYTSLPQGQLTFAVVQDGWLASADNRQKEPALLFLLDTKDKSPQLKTGLADLRKKWIDAGKNVKTEKIRDVEFSMIVLSSNDLPKSLRKAASAGPSDDDAPPGEKPVAAHDQDLKQPIYIGQADSLLIMGNSTRVIEKVLAAKSGESVKTLADLPAYSANHNAMFRDSPIFGWVNTGLLVNALKRIAPSSPDASADKIVSATGIGGLKTIGFNYSFSDDGAKFNLLLGIPADARSGIFQILAGEAKEVAPPPFVPANAVRYQRWRIDGRKAWVEIKKIVGDISPQSLSGLNALLSMAESAVKEKDPSFDIEKNLFGNLGDDVITWQKSPKGESLTELSSTPSIYLVGSPDAQQLASTVTTFLSLQGATPKDREFLGRKIYSLPLPSGAPTGAGVAKPSLSYASSGGYLAVSTDPAMLEEYLRSGQSDAKSLRDQPGLSAAVDKVSGGGTSLFGYSNEKETMRSMFTLLKLMPVGSGLDNLSPLAAATGVNESNFKDWIDLSLLPTFDQVSKYFYFSVYAGSATPDGLILKAFAPVPPQLKK